MDLDNDLRFNLALRLQEDMDLRQQLQQNVTRLTDLEKMRGKGSELYVKERNRLMFSVWKDCGMNFSLLAPYFFPSYPKGKPMSMLDRPFNMSMMFILPFWAFVLRGSRQIGKAQPDDEPVLTPRGFLPIGSLRVGDSVVAGDGSVCKVTGVFPQGEREVWSVRMLDGGRTRCDLDHLWKILTPGGYRVLSLRAILDEGLMGNGGVRIPRLTGGRERRMVMAARDGRAECRCIAVDSSDSTYVTRDHIVTHNTTTLGTRYRIMMEILTRMSALYIAPHTEPLKTFARKYEEISKSFRIAPPDNRYKQNMFYREYPRHNFFELARCQTSATPVRGKTASEIALDETVDAASRIPVLEGSGAVMKEIRDMRVGMTVVDFDEGRRVQHDKVTAVVCKGDRHTWRLITSEGKELVCTGSTRIFTDRGWFAICEFLDRRDAGRCPRTLRAQNLLRLAASIDPGHATWRRRHDFFAAAEQAASGSHRKSVDFPPALPDRIHTTDGWEDIESVEYAGMREVWDIETERHHTFFANGVGVHNCQLLDPNLETEILEVMADSNLKSVLYAGTSTTFDTLLEARYQEGCQAVWHVLRDNGQTINCGDPEQVIPAIGPHCMIDPDTKSPLDPLRGFYKFDNPEAFEKQIFSVHVPQVINPDIAGNPLEWSVLHRVMIRDQKKFVQEKLGIPVDSAAKEITEEDLKRICDPVTVGALEERRKRARTGFYRLIVSGADWGGSDYNQFTKSKISATTHAILGVTQQGQCHILHLRRHGGMDYKTIMNLMAADHAKFGAGAIGTDYGVGEVYHEVMRSHPTFSNVGHVIFHYTGPRTPVAATMKGGLSGVLNLNRTETLTALILALTAIDPFIIAPSWEEMEEYLSDFLNLHRVLVEKEDQGGQRNFVYRRDPSKTDDVVHALNFAYSLVRLCFNQLLVEDIQGRNFLRKAVLGDGAAQQGFVPSPDTASQLLADYNSDAGYDQDYYGSDYEDYA